MKQYFKHLHKDIWEHAFDSEPCESCGIIMNNIYYPCVNISVNKVSNFEIDKKAVLWAYGNGNKFQAVIHSHINYPHLSKEDMTRQIGMGVAWGIAFINDGKKGGIHFWGGDTEVEQLHERPFIHGLYDCYSLISDFYKVHFNINLPMITRENEWWDNNKNLFEDHFIKAGFSEVDRNEPKIGDIYLFKIKAEVVNHCAVNTGDGLMLHHLSRRLSNYTNIYPWIYKAEKALRKND